MSRNNKRRKVSAFTIPELLAGFIICALAIGAAAVTYVMISQAWKENLAINDLSRNANVAIEWMVHGKPGDRGNKGLVAATVISLPVSGDSADSVSYTDAFGSSRGFHYSDGRILAEDNDPVVSDVDSVTFSNIDDIVQIELALHKYVRNKEITLAIKTQVSHRNRP